MKRVLIGIIGVVVLTSVTGSAYAWSKAKSMDQWFIGASSDRPTCDSPGKMLYETDTKDVRICDNGGNWNLYGNANIQVGDADVSATNPVPVKTGDTVLEATLTLDTNAYADGDLLADTQLLDGSAFLANGGVTTVQNIQIQDYDDQKGALDIVLLRSNTSMGTENSAPNIADGDGDEILLVVPVYSTDYRDMGGFSIAEVDVGKVIKAAAADDALYIAAISRDAKTYTASGIMVRVALAGRQ